MRRIVIFALFILGAHALGQTPVIDNSFRKEMLECKSEHYKQMMLCEKSQTQGQLDYDARYYSLNLTPDIANQILNGTVEIIVEVTAASLTQVELNFWGGFVITSCLNASDPAAQLNYSRQNDILTVELERDYVTGEQITLTIVYTGRPQDSGYWSFIFDMHEGESMIWTLSSVFGARGWWPCKDVPSDKPDSLDIRVTLPSRYIVASNGRLRERRTNGGLTTTWWHEKYPIATYLVSLAVYPYEVTYDNYIYNSGADSMKIHFYTFPGNYQMYAGINGLVKDILTCYAERFGEYPFADEKYGQADFLWGGGMEHQTCTSYGTWNEALYAHEIAHQWWGDMITCDSFHHIWLNEGFASYAEAIWFEWRYPGYTASEYQMDYQLYLGPGTVFVEDPQTEELFHSGLSYNKGSWVLHMLRHVVGDDDFFEILKTYYSDSRHQYAGATTEAFKDICEQVSGMNLHRFFHQWIYEEYYPVYAYSWNSDPSGGNYDLTLEIRQEQDNTLFWMPLDITVSTRGGERSFVVWDSLDVQTFHFSVDEEPLEISIDRDNWVLKLIPERFDEPSLANGILLVNGVFIDIYGDEIRTCYENRAFWGEFEIDFWDCFAPPVDGYPATLPPPIGSGKVPGEILGRYSSVIWVGNDYGGDVGVWQQSSILPYLEAGGNVLLMTRNGTQFIYGGLQEYLGIQWIGGPPVTLQNCVADYPGLQNMAVNGLQSSNAIFETLLTSGESTLLFKETASFGGEVGLGVWHNPDGGGTHDPEGGQFIFLSGRPYRYDSDHLCENIMFILENCFRETGPEAPVMPSDLILSQNYPNPFNQTTTIEYASQKNAVIDVRIYNVMGRKVRTLARQLRVSQGSGTLSWDGRDENGSSVSSGVYFLELKYGGFSKRMKMVLMQ